MTRCKSLHPFHRSVRCEEPAGHLDEQRPHFHSFYARGWDEPWHYNTEWGYAHPEDFSGVDSPGGPGRAD